MTYKHKAFSASSPPSSCAYSHMFCVCTGMNLCVSEWMVCMWIVRMWMIGAYVHGAYVNDWCVCEYAHLFPFFFPCPGVKKDAWSSVWKGGEKKTLEVIPFQIVSYSNVFISILCTFVPLSMSHMYSHVLTFTHIYSYVLTCTHIYSHLLTFTHIYSHLLTFTHMYSHLLTCTHIYSHLLTFTHNSWRKAEKQSLEVTLFRILSNLNFVNIYTGYIHSAVNGSYALKFCCKKL